MLLVGFEVRWDSFRRHSGGGGGGYDPNWSKLVLVTGENLAVLTILARIRIGLGCEII